MFFNIVLNELKFRGAITCALVQITIINFETMDKGKGNSSYSQSNKSGGGSQSRSGNHGSSGKSSNTRGSSQQIVRELSNEMAKAAAPSYNEYRYLSQHTYDKFMGNDE